MVFVGFWCNSVGVSLVIFFVILAIYGKLIQQKVKRTFFY